ncbi:hypothetical protein [Streptomyces avermitilis]|uniref:hypothetical protein n=1 Tax=Streptomyces avermitilis TaxID=33903 RepID=UPI0038019B4C
MITLHELHQRGGDTAAAVTAFGNLHPQDVGPNQTPTPDWKTAERHFLELQIRLTAGPARPNAASRRERERLAENDAIGILLATPGGRCPICRFRAQAV